MKNFEDLIFCILYVRNRAVVRKVEVREKIKNETKAHSGVLRIRRIEKFMEKE